LGSLYILVGKSSFIIYDYQAKIEEAKKKFDEND